MSTGTAEVTGTGNVGIDGFINEDYDGDSDRLGCPDPTGMRTDLLWNNSELYGDGNYDWEGHWVYRGSE